VSSPAVKEAPGTWSRDSLGNPVNRGGSSADRKPDRLQRGAEKHRSGRENVYVKHMLIKREWTI